MDGSKWTVELTSITLGDTVLLDNSLEWGLVDTNVPGIGLTEEHFYHVAGMLTKNDLTIRCDERDCLGMNRCSDYEGVLPDFKFTISTKKTYYIASEKLLLDLPVDGY